MIWRLMLNGALLVALQPLQAAEGGLRIPESDCLRLVEHRAGAVDYEAGVDVRGKAVAPADLNQIDLLPEATTIFLSLDLMERLGLSQIEGLEADLPLGVIEIEGSLVTLNGQELAPETEQVLASLCRG